MATVRSLVARTSLAAVAAAGIVTALTLYATAGSALGTTFRSPAVLHVGQIDRQDVAPQPGCEPGTLVEPDVAVSPVNPAIAVAAAHDCRFPGGGAVDVSYAWTHDGGAHWHHAPLPGLTESVGGRWDRASDPVVAFGAGGAVYVAALVFNTGCATGVTVSRSTDGGATFGPPVLVHHSTTCAYSDDKDWLVIDTHRTSPFYGRIYVFWTAFISTARGKPVGSPQVVRWSDDSGRSWSATHEVTPIRQNTQDSQPMVQPDGTITDVYNYFPARSPEVSLLARVSHDGAATWGFPAVVAGNIGGGPPGIRCCLAASAADPVTGRLYTVWEAKAAGETVEIATARNGLRWSAPVEVTHTGTNPAIEHVNVAVAAYNGRAFVSYGLRDTSFHDGRYIQQQLSSSYDSGRHFGPPLSLGPLSDLKYAAVAQGKFPGDYIGASATASVVDLVWCVSSKPSHSELVHNQTMYAAVLRP